MSRSETSRGAETLDSMRNALGRAVEVVAGDPSANPLEVFPDPRTEERREDVAFDDSNISPEQEVAFRATMAELGPGREEDRGASEVGISDGYIALLEGGQAHKMIAELQLVLKDEKTKPGVIILSGSTGRKLGEAEHSLTAKLLDIDSSEVGNTEYAVALQVLEHTEGFASSPHDANDMSISGIPVKLMPIDRTPNPNDSSKYTQPDNTEKIIKAHDVDPIAEVGFVTSATYEPSCTIAARNAQQQAGDVHAKVLSYGTRLLAEVKGEEPNEPALNQLAGEAHKVAKLLKDLEQ